MSASPKNSIAPRLTRNQRRVFMHLGRIQKAQGAYEIAAELGAAAVTVYRALKVLTSLGFVHAIPSQNAYVACGLASRHHNAALIVCADCNVVREVQFDVAVDHLRRVASRDRFAVDHITIEVVGHCTHCHGSAADQHRPVHHHSPR